MIRVINILLIDFYRYLLNSLVNNYFFKIINFKKMKNYFSIKINFTLFLNYKKRNKIFLSNYNIFSRNIKILLSNIKFFRD